MVTPVCGFLLWFGSTEGVFIRTRVGRGLSVVAGGVSLTVLPTNPPPHACMHEWLQGACRQVGVVFVHQAMQHINGYLALAGGLDMTICCEE